MSKKNQSLRIVIGFLSSIAFDYFPRVMREFRARYPEVLENIDNAPLLVHAVLRG